MIESTPALAAALLDGIRTGDLNEASPSVLAKVADLQSRMDRELSAINWARTSLPERDGARDILSSIYASNLRIWMQLERITQSAANIKRLADQEAAGHYAG